MFEAKLLAFASFYLDTLYFVSCLQIDDLKKGFPHVV